MSTTTSSTTIEAGYTVAVYRRPPAGLRIDLYFVVDSNATGTVLIPVDGSGDAIGADLHVRDLPDFLGDDWEVVA
jgi:hypothetical protein